MPFDLAVLRTSVRPFKLHWFPRLRSTNDHAALLRRRKALFAPAIVLTGHQLAGRGRGSNTWWSGTGSLTVTFAMAEDESIAPHQVPLIAGLAVRNAAAELTGDAAIQLKWPNDLLFEDRKLAGLLCERVNRIDLIGLGLNINVRATDVPKNLRECVTSLQWITGVPLNPSKVLATIARHLHGAFALRGEMPFHRVLAEYDRHHALRGRRISVFQSDGEPPVRGICKGMDSMGRLLISDGRAAIRIIAGRVEYRA